MHPTDSQSAGESRPEWLKPRDAYGWRATFRNTLPLSALMALAPVLADHSLIAAWSLAPVMGLLIYRSTVVMHDCTHNTLFTSRRRNRLIGSALGAVSGVCFRGFAQEHWKHHRLYGQAGDPQAFHYAQLNRMTPRQFSWHFVKPLLGLNLRHTFAQSIFAPRNLIRLIATGEIVLVALIQIAVLCLVTGMGRHTLLAALPLVSAATFGLFFSQIRGIAEHGTVGDVVAAGYVRTHAAHWLERILLYDVHFNYHAEHHRHPQIPSCHLRAVHESMSRHMPSASHSMSSTLRTLYSNLKHTHA